MKAVLIARVSTQELQEADNALTTQIERLERYCHNKGLTVDKIYSFSGNSTDPEEFARLIEYVHAQKEPIALCCDDVDRFSHNPIDTRTFDLYTKALEGAFEIHHASNGQVIASTMPADEKFHLNINIGLAKHMVTTTRR